MLITKKKKKNQKIGKQKKKNKNKIHNSTSLETTVNTLSCTLYDLFYAYIYNLPFSLNNVIGRCPDLIRITSFIIGSANVVQYIYFILRLLWKSVSVLTD